jgi:hypothetical protein
MRVKQMYGAALAALVAPAGCAAPRESVATVGVWPAEAVPSFGFGDFVTDDSQALRTRIASCLIARGMIASDKPSYLVQIGRSEVPGGVRVIDPPTQPARKTMGGGRMTVLAVSLSEVETGREAWRVTVTRPVRQTGKASGDLADAACAAINASH